MPTFHPLRPAAPLAVAAGLAAFPSILLAQACGVPIPTPGQTVTWDASGSPYTVCQQLVIPEGGTVMVEPGVEIRTNGSTPLIVRGALIGTGTASSPVVINGPANSWYSIVAEGRVELSHADVNGSVRVPDFGVFHLSESTLRQNMLIMDNGALAVLDGVEFVGSDLTLIGQSDIRGLTTSANVRVQGYTRLEDITIDGGVLEIVRDYQPFLVDGISVTNANDAAVQIRGGTDYLFTANNTIENNLYPVQIEGAGLMPRSVLPLSGNTNNAIMGPELGIGGVTTWPDLGLDYHLHHDVTVNSAQVSVGPGATLRFGPGAHFLVYTGEFEDSSAFRGLPGAPIHLERLDPSQEWSSLAQAGGFFMVEHVEIDGAGLGISAPQSTVYVTDAVISNCARGTSPSSFGVYDIRGTRFLNNGVGAESDHTITHTAYGLRDQGRPNSFVGNGIACLNSPTPSGTLAPFEAGYCWWGDAGGPSGAGHPGSGDQVSAGIQTSPWLSSPPDLSDQAPVARLVKPVFTALPGETILVQWEASDDGAITDQRILADTRGGGMLQFFPVLEGIDPGARAAFVTLPEDVSGFGARSLLLRLEITDDNGETSFDQVSILTPPVLPTGSVSFRVPDGWTPGQEEQICYDALGTIGASLRLHVMLDADGRMHRGPSGSPGVDSCTFAPVRVPRVSTDRARIALQAIASGDNQEWHFSEPFEIRPAEGFGDQPPLVEMHTPAAGAFAGGDTLQFSWSSSDDEGLHEHRIQASFNGGRTWQTIGRADGDATAFQWRVPDLELELPDVRFRVVAVDLRFQNSADGDDAQFALLPGQGAAGCNPADLAEPLGVLDLADVQAFIAGFTTQDPISDLDGNGVWDLADVQGFIAAFNAGCP